MTAGCSITYACATLNHIDLIVFEERVSSTGKAATNTTSINKRAAPTLGLSIRYAFGPINGFNRRRA